MNAWRRLLGLWGWKTKKKKEKITKIDKTLQVLSKNCKFHGITKLTTITLPLETPGEVPRPLQSKTSKKNKRKSFKKRKGKN